MQSNLLLFMRRGNMRVPVSLWQHVRQARARTPVSQINRICREARNTNTSTRGRCAASATKVHSWHPVALLSHPVLDGLIP